MNSEFKNVMAKLIEEEIANIEQSGEKVRLKTLSRKRLVYTLIFGGIFLLCIGAGQLALAFITMIFYYTMLYRATNVSVITKLAKKSPDTYIEDIIRGDMK